MTSPVCSRKRHLFAICMLTLMALGLVGRAIDLQVNHHEFLRNQADARHLRVVRISADRGKILDRYGAPLAISTPVDSVWANPQELAAERQRWAGLTSLLGLETEELQRLLAKRLDREFVYLKRHVNPRLAEDVSALGIRGVYLQREYRRYYPTGEVSAHVVGFTNVDDVGQEGIELAYNHWLEGTDGSKRVLRDRLGRVVEDIESIKSAYNGQDLVLSIDRRIQYIAYRALKTAVQRHGAASGSAVVLDVRTGEVLAMVNQPSFNPNKGRNGRGARLRNRSVTDLFEPGSAIKPFTVVTGLESGKFQANTLVDTRPGHYRVGGHTVRDLRNYGQIDVTTIIKKSSNVGVSKIALALPPEDQWQTLSSFGFGRTTGSGFPGESPGILTDPQEWSDIHRATLAFGYGLSVTPLQLAQAYSVIANDGVLYPVTFLRSDGTAEPTRVVAAEVTRELRTILETVTDEGGTGRRARISGYRVAGKTGTSRKSTLGGYSSDRYIAVFAGMAPASNPRLVAVVTVDEPSGEAYYGGEVAAPVFASITAGALRLMGVAPDDPLMTTEQMASTAKLPKTFDLAGNSGIQSLAQ